MVRAEVEVRLVNRIIPREIALYTTGFDGSQLALPHGVSALIERWRAVRTLAGRGGRA